MNWFSYRFCAEEEKAGVPVRVAGLKPRSTVKVWIDRAEAQNYATKGGEGGLTDWTTMGGGEAGLKP